MRAYREEAPIREERRGIVVIAVIAAAVVFGTLLYWGLRDTAEPAQDASLQVIRDAETVAAEPLNAAEVEPPAVQEATPATGDFAERQLGPPRTTVGAGEAPVVANQGEEGETLVIDGELLEELEADAEAATAATP